MKTQNFTYQEIKITSHHLSKLKQKTIYYLLKNLSFSEAYLNKLRKNTNFLLLNNTPATLKSQIYVDDILKIATNPSTKATKIQEINTPLDILFEDDDYLIVNKPHGLSCMPSKSHFFDNLGGQLVYYMKKQENFVLRILNRLDKDTSGIVVVAKNLLAYKHFKFTTKEYFALCEGILDAEEFTINKPILTKQDNGINIMQRTISPLGKNAITHISRVQNFNNYSLFKATLETGRTHQIRVHMASEKHPLLCDPIYNPKHQTQSQQEGCHTFLLLKKISFFHFSKKNEISIDIPFPTDWNLYLHPNNT